MKPTISISLIPIRSTTHCSICGEVRERAHRSSCSLSSSFFSVHNHVNQRLQNDITEDPKHPKVLFPSADLCPTCQPSSTSSDHEFDQSNTIQFLLQFYSKDNIDSSSVEESQILEQKGKPSLDEYSMLELSHSASETSFFSSLIVSIKHHFLLYALAALVIIAVVLRRRHCKLKRKRYTL